MFAAVTDLEDYNILVTRKHRLRSANSTRLSTEGIATRSALLWVCEILEQLNDNQLLKIEYNA